jgi:MFS transporter, NNP family, nitrate/nitrite transporter
VIARVSDDGPGGNYKEMKKNGTMDIQQTTLLKGADSKNAWLLAVAYACSFGVEITVNNAGSLYFQDQFGLTTQSAAAAASIFGLTNIFARAVGGIASDMANARLGIQGRLILSTVLIILQGAAIIGFSYCTSLASALIVMAIMACFVNATEGAIFGIVPYVNPAVSGTIAGIVGMGGNIGGIFFAVAFHHLSYHNAFIVMGASAIASSLLNFFIYIPGCSRLWTRDGAITEELERPTATGDATGLQLNDRTSL